MTPLDLPDDGKALSTEAFIAALDAGIRQPGRDRTTHPFIAAVEDGSATLNQIAGWRHQITLWAHPTNLLYGHMYAHCPDDDLRQMIFENMAEEEHGATSGAGGHISLNYRFLEELGWGEARRAADHARPETWLLRHWFEVVITERPIVDSIASLSFTAERLNPEVLGRVYQGLRKNYKISDDGLMSLAVHASHVEEEHGSLGPVAFERYAATAYDQARVRFAVFHTAEVYYNMYNVWTGY